MTTLVTSAISKGWNDYINEVLVAAGEPTGGEISRLVRATTTFRTAANFLAQAERQPNEATRADSMRQARRYHLALVVALESLEGMFKDVERTTDAVVPPVADAPSKPNKKA